MASDATRPREAAVEVLTTRDDLRAVVRDGTLEIVIDRPERRNALTAAMINRLHSLLREAEKRADLRAVLLTGTGEKAFCAGFDIADINSPGSDTAGAERDMVNELATALTEIPVPVVAAVNGAAVGAGCDLALSCDIRIGTHSARFGMPPVRLGILYAWPGMLRLLRAAGYPMASEMLLTGDILDADRALTAGLVSRIVDADRLLDHARSVCRRLAENSPVAVRASKESLRLLAGTSVDGETERRLTAIQETVWSSGDAQEGARAYREGRKPRFSGGQDT
jgi:enoyl-CoA hydratase